MNDAEYIETEYKCTGCGAPDHDRGHGGRAPTALNCWQCGAGRGRSIQEMVNAEVGMFPVAPADPVAGQDVNLQDFVQ